MTLLCYYCSAEITWKRRRIVHINICQKPSTTYFCNRDCKLNWIFKKTDLKLESDIEDDWIKEDVETILDMSVLPDNTDELEDYLKENNLKIIRNA